MLFPRHRKGITVKLRIASEDNLDTHTYRMVYPSYEQTQSMPSLKEIAERLERQSDRVPSEKSKGKQKESREQEGEKANPIDLDTSPKPKPQKSRSRHAKQVEFLLQEYQEEAEKQGEETEEDTSGDPRVSEGKKVLARKRSFQEAAISQSEDSDGVESGAGKNEAGRRNIPYTGGQPGVEEKSSGPKSAPPR